MKFLLNQKSKFLRLGLFLIMLNFTLGCADDPVDPTDMDLIANTWKASEVKKGLSTSALNLIYSATLAGNWVDYTLYRLTFNEEGTYRLIDRLGEETSGTWAFIADNTQILFDESTADETQALILNLTATETILQFEEPNDKFGLLVSEFTLVPSFN